MPPHTPPRAHLCLQSQIHGNFVKCSRVSRSVSKMLETNWSRFLSGVDSRDGNGRFLTSKISINWIIFEKIRQTSVFTGRRCGKVISNAIMLKKFREINSLVYSNIFSNLNENFLICQCKLWLRFTKCVPNYYIKLIWENTI